MRAILDATGYRQPMAPLLSYKPTPLWKIGGKPILFHVIEFLMQQGIKECDIILNYLPQKIEKALGNGERWGMEITYHLAKNPLYPFQAIRPLAYHLKKGVIVLGTGDCLPEIPPQTFQNALIKEPLVFTFPDKKWSGWAILPIKMLESVPKDILEGDFLAVFKGMSQAVIVEAFLSTNTPQEVQESNFKFINQSHALSLFPTTARQVAPGVWISRGVSIHPTAIIKAPVFIGEFSQINQNAIIGPDAIIEDQCIIDESSTIESSLICHRSYIGEDLLIKNCIIDRNRLVNLSHQLHLTITDDFILGVSYPSLFKFHPLYWIERGIALFLFLLLSPFYLFMKKSHELKQKEMLKLPASDDPALWKTFKWEIFKPKAGFTPSKFHMLFWRLPLLKSIISGDIHFVGVVARTKEDVERLPPDWRRLYTNSKVGIISASSLENEDEESLDKNYASEALYAVQKSSWHDMWLIWQWAIKKFNNAPPRN